MSPISSALAGFNQAETILANSAQALSTLALPSEVADVDTVELSSEVVSLIAARNTAALSAKVFHTADDIAQNVLSLLG